FSTMMEVVIGAKAQAVEQAKDNDGSVEAFDDDVQKQIATYAKTLSDKTAQKADVADVPSTLSSAGEEWQKTVTDLGFDEKGDFATLVEWYPEDVSYDDLGDELFDTVMAEHRPEGAREGTEVGGSRSEIESLRGEVDALLIVVHSDAAAEGRGVACRGLADGVVLFPPAEPVRL